jgi:hypothetical protein
MPRVRLLRHVVYFAYAARPGASARRVGEVVDYFVYATHPGASARHAARQAARSRLL